MLLQLNKVVKFLNFLRWRSGGWFLTFGLIVLFPILDTIRFELLCFLTLTIFTIHSYGIYRHDKGSTHKTLLEGHLENKEEIQKSIEKLETTIIKFIELGEKNQSIVIQEIVLLKKSLNSNYGKQ